MPYANNSDLPKNVRDNLPEHAQTIYRKAYNSAAEQNPDYDEERLAKIAWSAVGKVYHKVGDTWVRLESAVFRSMTRTDRYADNGDIVVNAIKVGTEAFNAKGGKITFTEEMLEEHSASWTDGFIAINHAMLDEGKIASSWFESPFTKMRLSGLSDETKKRILSDEYRGVSQDSFGSYDENDDPTFIGGSGLSIIFYPYEPVCSKEIGCGLASATIMKTDDDVQYPASCYLYVPEADKPSTWKLRICEMVDGKRDTTVKQLGRAAAAFSEGGFRGRRVQLPSGEVSKVKAKLRSLYRKLGVDDKNIPSHILGSAIMAEKTYTDTEIQDLVTKAAEYATLESSVKQSADAITTLEKQIGDLTSTISEKDQTMGEMFTSAQIDEAKTTAVEEAVEKATSEMFTSAQVEDAKTEAVKLAVEQAELKATDRANFKSSLPEGIEETLETELMSMVESGDSIGAYRKLHSTVEWKSFKAHVPTGTGGQTLESAEAFGGAGVYDPVAGSFKKVGE